MALDDEARWSWGREGGRRIVMDNAQVRASASKVEGYGISARDKGLVEAELDRLNRKVGRVVVIVIVIAVAIAIVAVNTAKSQHKLVNNERKGIWDRIRTARKGRCGSAAC